MTKLVLDSVTLEKLLYLAEPLDLFDDSGRRRAVLTPIYDPEEFGPLEPQVSEEELRRRESSTEPRYSIGEVLRHLEQL
ncbi:MAG TPA: hypothetical protein VMV10_05515 [Pirellulales bacterium]|nr:hypothetical protein [Pirellulales bacterium]